MDFPTVGGRWGNVQLNLPILTQQQQDKAPINNNTTAAAAADGSDVNAGSPEQQEQQQEPLSAHDLQQLLQPPHEAVLQAVELLSQQQLLITAVELTGWQLHTNGWEKLLKNFEATNALRKLVVRQCDITAATAGEHYTHMLSTIYTHPFMGLPSHAPHNASSAL